MVSDVVRKIGRASPKRSDEGAAGGRDGGRNATLATNESCDHATIEVPSISQISNSGSVVPPPQNRPSIQVVHGLV